ncbi:DUF2062 domain-containing protein [Arenimonas sp. MALMAid1274]|uniref:DUF2062 domain-containing protein n=1 Tax=Arenimonas sp. MALMAid1274 TaxID=3411630 RepID=UPI003BA22EF9
MPVRSHPLHRRWLARRKRLRRWLRPLPRRANVARYPVLKWFAEAARRRPYLWSFKRGPVMRTLYAGSVLALLPVQGLQVSLGLALAILLRGNLTLMVALQLVVNPLTMAPVYYVTYQLGRKVMTLLGAGAAAEGLQGGVYALVVGGVVGGLAVALLLDLAWRAVAWEARHFRAQLAALHLDMGYRHGGHEAPPLPLVDADHACEPVVPAAAGSDAPPALTGSPHDKA